jgi:hypothetical protein
MKLTITPNEEGTSNIDIQCDPHNTFRWSSVSISNGGILYNGMICTPQQFLQMVRGYIVDYVGEKVVKEFDKCENKWVHELLK